MEQTNINGRNMTSSILLHLSQQISRLMRPTIAHTAVTSIRTIRSPMVTGLTDW